MKQTLLSRRLPQLPLKTFFLAFGIFLITTLSVSAQKYFELHDAYNNRAAIGGDNFNGQTYHDYPYGRLNAQWKFELVADSFYTITDKKHNKLLGAGINFDNQTYHYEVTNADHVQWSLVDVDGRGVLFYIKNKKHNNKFLACWDNGGNGNNDLLLQDTSSAVKKKCASWRLIEKQGTGEMPKDVK